MTFTNSKIPEELLILVLSVTFVLCFASVSEGRGPKACADLSTLPAGCTQKSSKDYSGTLATSTGPLMGMAADLSANIYVIQNAFNSFKTNNLATATLNKGIISKYSADKGVLAWEKLTCGSGNTFFSNIVATTSQVNIGGTIENVTNPSDLCIFNAVSGSNTRELDGRNLSFFVSLDSSSGIVRFVKSLDVYNGSTILSMTSDASDNVIIAQKVKKYGSGVISMDGITVTLPNNDVSNVVISEFSNVDGNLRWSSVLCEDPSSEEACQVISIHSSYGVDDNVLIVLSVKGSVVLKNFGKISSQVNMANIFLVGLSKNGQKVRFAKTLSYSLTIDITNVKATINQAGEMVLALACSDNCIINQEMVNPGIYLIQFNMFKLSIDYVKLFVPISNLDTVQVASIAIDAAGNPYTIIKSLSTPQITIYDSDSRKSTFVSPNVLLVKHTASSGSVYWAQPIVTFSTVSKLFIPNMFRSDSYVYTFPTIPVVYQDNNQVNLNTFQPCLGTVSKLSTSYFVGGSGGDHSFSTDQKVKSIACYGEGTVKGIVFNYFVGEGFKAGTTEGTTKTIIFDPDEYITELEMSVDRGTFITNVGYIRIKTDRQQFTFGQKRSSSNYNYILDNDKTVIAWSIKSGTHVDSITAFLGDRANGYPLYCDCKSGFEGSTCERTQCYGQDATATGVVCSGKGSCSGPNSCACNLGYSGHACIDVNYCNNNSSLADPLLCGTGTCKSDLCDCKPGFYGERCQYWDCYGIQQTNTSYACSANGQCQSPNNCQCYDYTKYGGLQCQLPICNFLLSNHSDVCTGHGICTAPEKCACEPNYLGQYCEEFSCFGIERNSSNVCNTRGKCIGINQCKCTLPYYGNECQLYDCHGVVYNDNNVCSSHGQCGSPNNCTCQAGYFSNDCSLYQCSGKLMNDSSVCSGRGTCQSPNNCSCVEGHSGQVCENYYCFNVFKGNSSVCSGNGNCISSNNCQCKYNFNGTNCETCANNYFGKRCTNSIPNRRALMTSTTSVEIEIGLCRPKLLSTFADSNGNYQYRFTIIYSSNPTFIPGDVFEFNVFCLESETPVFVPMVYDDSQLVYTDPVVELAIDTGGSGQDEAAVHKCFSTTFKITKWSQYEKRETYRSINWTIVGSDSYGVETTSAKNQLYLTIPAIFSSEFSSLTLEVMFETYFGKKKLFSFNFPISSKSMLPHGSAYSTRLRIKNNVLNYVKPSSFISNPCASQLASPYILVMIPSSDALQVSYQDQQFALKNSLFSAPRTTSVRFYQTSTNYFQIDFTFTYEIAAFTMNPTVFIDSRSTSTVLSCTDASEYGSGTHRYELQCYNCQPPQNRSKEVSFSTASSSSTTYDLSIFGLGSKTLDIGVRCFRTNEILSSDVSFTNYKVSLINSNSFNDECKILSFRIKNLVGVNLPFTSSQTEYQIEVIMSSSNCPVKLTVSNQSDTKYTIYEGTLINRLNTIPFVYVSGAIEKSGGRVFSFSSVGNTLRLDSSVDSSTLLINSDPAPAYPSGCSTIRSVYNLLETVSISCSTGTGVSYYAIYLDDFFLTRSTSFPLTFTVPMEGTLYLASVSSSGGIDKRKIATAEYSASIFTQTSNINTFVNGVGIISSVMPLQYSAFFYYYPLKKPQMDEKQMVSLYETALNKATSYGNSYGFANADSLNLLLHSVACLSNPYLMKLSTFSSTVKFLYSFMDNAVSNVKKNPSLWTKRSTKSLGIILTNLNIFTVQVADIPFSSYSAPSSYILYTTAQITGEITQKELFGSSTQSLSPIVYAKSIRQESISYLSITDSNSNRWITLNSQNVYPTLSPMSSIQEVIVNHAIIKKPVPSTLQSTGDVTSDYLSQFSMTGAETLPDKNRVFISVPLSSKPSNSFGGKSFECVMVYDTDTWTRDYSCSLVDTFEALVPEISSEKILMANCSCLLTSVMKLKTTSRNVQQTSSTTSNNAIGVYIYDNGVGVGLGIFFGLIVPLFYITALVVCVVGAFLFWKFKIKPNSGKANNPAVSKENPNVVV
ncbi:predicted protein [Naegleria gruberi]|uniref:Predicted protein n=1 Tax=Naegleria gruberi TaxID=5762 RepID=D2W026_NAEGR|nr:uncharacterized protein NAEGRDRAFT_74706 [Naegleria gruberi]EFC37499.1 predicted protein [Naegleria gruberi]|eukprot:XP_002670243.1 predicted protein [Naegleria gruberi strain NEG-M]